MAVASFGTGLPCILALQIWVHLAGRCSYIHHRLVLQAKVSPYCINLASRGYSTQQHFCNCRSCNGIFFSRASSFPLSHEIYIQLLLFPLVPGVLFVLSGKHFPGSSFLCRVSGPGKGRRRGGPHFRLSSPSNSGLHRSGVTSGFTDVKFAYLLPGKLNCHEGIVVFLQLNLKGEFHILVEFF